MLEIICGNEAVSCMPVVYWIKRFRRKREDLENDTPTAQNPEIVSKVRELVARGRQMTKIDGGFTVNELRDVSSHSS